jgi:CRP/FNR family cyclic AMP-dependent transcriptional regulator
VDRTPPEGSARTVKGPHAFDMTRYLEAAGASPILVCYHRNAVVFGQGEPCRDVRYLQAGRITLSVLSRSGKEAVVALVAPGDFFGEGCLAGHVVQMSRATAMAASLVLIIEKATMSRLLHDEAAFSDRFIAHMLARNIRVEADLVDQLFNSSEKRLARALMLLARYGETDTQPTVPKISQATLGEMIGATRSSVNVSMNKFRKLGLIEYTAGRALVIHKALLTVVLHD